MRHAVLALTAVAAAASPALAQTAPAAQACCPAPVQPTTLTINAESQVRQAPDIATVSAGVVTTARSAKAAMDQNAERMTAVFAAVRAAGVAERDLQTSGVNLQPQYDVQPNQRPRITGYQAVNTVTVRIRDLAKIGPVLDSLVAQGANTIDGPSFGIDNPEAALDAAREEAMKKAIARANLYARAAGLKVRRIVTINENAAYAPQPMPRMVAMRAEAMAADAQTPVAPGEVTMTAQVGVIFELER